MLKCFAVCSFFIISFCETIFSGWIFCLGQGRSDTRQHAMANQRGGPDATESLSPSLFCHIATELNNSG